MTALPLRKSRTRPIICDDTLIAAIWEQQRWHAFEDDWFMPLQDLHMAGFLSPRGVPVRAEGIAYWCTQLARDGRLIAGPAQSWRVTR